MIEYLFLDLDDTILDFHKAERIAISKTFREFGLEPTDEVLQQYHEINIMHWQMLERGELTREEVLVNRFGVLFEKRGIQVNPERVARTYEKNLGIGHYFLPGAEEAVKRLHEKYRLYLASNGTASVQHSRMTSAGLYPYFEEVFISQKLGYNKPSREYFDACYERISGFDLKKAIMVGDSLTSDIQGGKNGGMRTVWVNPGHKDCGSIVPDFQIESITQLEALLETL